jgi:hypothetical protein
VLGQVNQPHPPFPDRSHDAVTPQSLPEHEL